MKYLKNLLLILSVAALVLSFGNSGSEKEFTNMCQCLEWAQKEGQRIDEMNNSEFRDEFDDYKLFKEYSKEKHPECKKISEDFEEDFESYAEKKAGNLNSLDYDEAYELVNELAGEYLKEEFGCSIEFMEFLEIKERVDRKFVKMNLSKKND